MIREKIPKSRDVLLALIGVWTVAVVKPVLDVVGAAPAYWSANRIDGVTVCIVAFVLTLLPPAGLACIYYALRGGRFPLAARVPLFSTVFTILLALAGYHSLSLIFGKPIVLIPASIVAAALVTWLYWRFELTRSFFNLFSVMALLVPVVFLFSSPTRSLLLGSEADTKEIKYRVVAKQPVIILVFDELSLASLIDSEGDINAKLFPNFSRLAEISMWFQNTTANYGSSDRSVPSILTGRFQAEEEAGTSYKQNPRNLFTLVDAPAGVLVVEQLTNLCPPALSGELSRSFLGVLEQVTVDFLLVYQNILVPDRLSSRVRPLPQRFRNLAASSGSEPSDSRVTDPADIVQHLSDWLHQGRRESLVFLHFNLPHAPYLMNPDGTAYSKMGSYDMIGWSSNGHTWSSEVPFYAVQGFQRYLLQTMFADKMLGTILDILEERGLLAESTLVVTADHGVAFTPGEKRRAWELDPAVVGENNAVPLFWKSPGQPTGKSTRNVELIDILPTLLDEMGDDQGAGDMDGQSIWSPSERQEKVFAGSNYAKDVWPDVTAANQRRFSEVIVTESKGSVFVRPAKYSSLIGVPIAEAQLTNHVVNIDNPLIFDTLANFDERSSFRPNFIEGWLETGSDFDTLGVAINGAIADVVEVYIDRFGTRKFSSLFDPSILEHGSNSIQFVGVHFLQSGEAVLSLLQSSNVGFHLVGDTLVNERGDSLERDQSRLVGGFDILGCSNSEMLHVKGWLGDRNTWRAPPSFLIVYQGEEQLSRPSLFRSGFIGKIDGLTNSGFDTYLRLQGKQCLPETFRMFVIFDDHAFAEMKNVIGMQPQEKRSPNKPDQATKPGQTSRPDQTTNEPKTFDFQFHVGVPENARGERLRREQDRLVGAFDTLSCSNSKILHIKGWLGDRSTWKPPLAFLVVYYGETQMFYPSLYRSGFVDKAEGLVNSGFDTYLESEGNPCNPESFRMFVIFDEKSYAVMKNIVGMQPSDESASDLEMSFHLNDDGVPSSSTGVPLKLDQERLVGAFDTLGCSTPELLHIKGWLGDRLIWYPPLSFIVSYQGDEQMLRPSLRRPGFVGKRLEYSVFDLYFESKGKPCNVDDFRMRVIFSEEAYAEMRNVLGMQ